MRSRVLASHIFFDFVDLWDCYSLAFSTFGKGQRMPTQSYIFSV